MTTTSTWSLTRIDHSKRVLRRYYPNAPKVISDAALEAEVQSLLRKQADGSLDTRQEELRSALRLLS